MKLVIMPTKLAKGEKKENIITANPPSISSGMIGTINILASGETIGKSPEKYIRYGSIKNGRPIAKINVSRKLSFHLVPPPPEWADGGFGGLGALRCFLAIGLYYTQK